MKWFNNLSIKLKLNIGIIGIIALVMSIMAIYLFTTLRSHFKHDIDNDIEGQIYDLKNMIEIQVSESQKKVNLYLKTAHYYFYNQGRLIENPDQKIPFSAINQETQGKTELEVSQWSINANPVQKNFDIVDSLKALGIEAATIFQKIPEGYLRISTNVIKKDGSRANGTFIPSSSPVAQAIDKGATYMGRAYVVDDWYLAAYEPIYMNGSIKGMLFVGAKEKDMASLKAIFKTKKYNESGFPYIVTTTGELIVHPSDEGKNIAQEPIFKTIDALKDSITEIEMNGESTMVFFHYYDPIKAYIVINIPSSEVYDFLNQIGRILSFSFIIVLALIILAVYYISRQISDQLNRSIEFVQRISEGDLTVHIVQETEDEIGQLLKTMQNMSAHLREVVSNISAGSENIASSSEELSSAAESLSDSSTEQASSLEEISSSIDQMVTNIQHSTVNVKQLDSITNKLVTDIQTVGDASTKSMTAINKISEKITIINDIAFQTNILALNAAVEAARAGEHGRGFAVVAAEVRKLAERSKIAADEINMLAKETITLTQRTETLIKDVIPEVKQASVMIDEITASNIEESEGTSQINNGVQQLNDITQHNASSSEQLASNAEQLASEATQLKAAIQFFKV